MKYPLISIAIATFNSEKTLKKTLDSIKKQTYPAGRIETLIIDGGSSDKTLAIAKKYQTKIIPNKQTELIYAKYIGFYQAKGKYLIYLDSDEVLETSKSLEIKYAAINQNQKIKAVLLSGYKTPPDSPQINNYINEFGDPFSFFVYRESKGDHFLIQDFSRKYKKNLIANNRYSVVIDFNRVQPLPLIELWAGGCMIDLEYTRKVFPQIKKNPGLIAHLFYLLNAKEKYLAISKGDNTIHYSVPSFEKYLKKLSSRIKNNVFSTDMGKGGFKGRERYQDSLYQFRRFVFLPYALTLLFPFIDGVILVITRRKIIYLVHPVLCFYTAFLIVFYYALKLVGLRIEKQSYGN